jgi:hypothetical protein
MVIVANVYLRFYIEARVVVGTCLLTPTPPKISSDPDSDFTALVVHNGDHIPDFKISRTWCVCSERGACYDM